MKNIPVFTTEHGAASLFLREIPYRKRAHIKLQATQEPEKLLEECISFCRACGAEWCDAAGNEITFIFTKNTYSDLTGRFLTAYQDGDKLAFIGKTADANDTNYIENTGTLTLKLGNAQTTNGSYGTDAYGNTLYQVSSQSYSLYFCGGDSVELCHNARTNAATGSDADYFTTPFTFDREAHMTANKHYDLTKVVSTANCGYDGVVAHTCVLCDRVANDVTPATGDHTVIACSACADKCTTCLKYIQKDVQSHNLNEIMTYANGFSTVGSHNIDCANEGCDHIITESIPALFENRGYSYPEDGNSVGISIRFIVDKDAVKAYEDFTGSKINYGLFAGLETALGNNDVLDENGDQVDGIIVADLTEGAFTVFEIKMMGFAETQATTSFAIGAYVIETNGETKKYSYLQGAEPTENQKYCFVTYNDFAK